MTTNASEKTCIVHKQDAEGSLLINWGTGQIETPHDERPEWAEYHSIANTAERHLFYMNRLEDLYTADMISPDVIAYEDLMWTCLKEYPADAPYMNTETGAPETHEVFTVEADHEFRQQVLSAKLDIRSELDKEGNETGSIEGSDVEVAIAADNLRTAEELEALEQNKEQGFKSVTG